MKKYKIVLFANLLTLSLFATETISQSTSVIKTDAIVHVSDTVVFRLTDYVGEHVKWQLSHNLEDWAEIPGATSDSLLFVADTTTFFRARVIAGFCDPFYSDAMKVQVHHQAEPGTVVDIDGNVYQTVIITDQEWMAENLRVTRYNNGDQILTGLSDAEWLDTTEGAYAIYNNNNDMLEAYGKLYNWFAVDDERGLCPEGWSVPSNADWTDLVNYVVSQGYPNEWTNPGGAGNALKSCRQVGSPLEGCNTSIHPRWNYNSTHFGFDAFGFSALPGGCRLLSGSYMAIGEVGYWWSSCEFSTLSAWRRFISLGGDVNMGTDRRRTGFSVRCFRNISVYNLNLDVNPENAGIVNGAGMYPDGMLISVTANANEGWEFVNWTGDTEYLDDVNSAEAIVTMPAYDINLIANFNEETDYPVYGDGVTDIDGNEYVTVIIGNQEWMAENLRVTRYNNEDDIPTGLSDAEWESNTEGAYAIYDHNESNTDGINSPEEMVAAYGKLYNWYAVDDTRGLCPEGWSVPSHDDWTQLEQYICNALGNTDCETLFPYDNTTAGWRGTNEGNALKSCRQVGSPLEGCNTSEHPRWNSHSTHYGFDEFGFSTLPVGRRLTFGHYYLIGYIGGWWSSSEHSSTHAWFRGMGSNYGTVGRHSNYKRNGFSVRCVRDIDN